MKHHFKIISVGLMIFLTGCSKQKEPGKSMEQLHQEAGVPVRVLKISASRLHTSHSFYAVLSGWKESTGAAMVNDKVEKIHHKVGDYVRQDDIVISFPDDNPASQYRQAKAACELAETTRQRLESLYESGGIPLQELDQAKTQAQIAEANWDAVRQTLHIRAPISGFISRITVRETDNVRAGTPLFTVSDNTRLKSRLWTPASVIRRYSVGDSAQAVWGNEVLSGKIIQMDRSPDELKQAFGIWVEFENPGRNVLSGVNSEITLSARRVDPAIWIERKNIRMENDTAVVFIAENDRAEKRIVQTGRSQDLDVEIISGLEDGTELITEGISLLEDGVKIHVQP